MTRLFPVLSVLFPMLLTLGYLPLSAQNIPGLAAYYSFEGDLTDVSGTSANEGIPVGTPDFLCGLLTIGGAGEALGLGGNLSSVAVTGPLLDEFNDEDFSISFYINPTGTEGIQNILSKTGSACGQDSSLSIQYLPANRILRARFTETSAKEVRLETELPENRCWHHITLVREDIRIRMFVNGELVDDAGTAGVIDLSNDGAMVMGEADCLVPGETPFEGRLDELAFFSRALTLEQVQNLYIFPDRILNPAVQVFLGESVQVELGPSCGNGFQWSPPADVDQPVDAEPVITPVQAGLQEYALRIAESGAACVAMDTLRIQVVDPADLDCNRLFLPSAFTPNADGLNDGFGISNPFAVQELVRFEIFDRWGSKVYSSIDPFERWDGSFDGSPLNPGVMLYRLVTICDGQEIVKTGSVTLIR